MRLEKRWGLIAGMMLVTLIAVACAGATATSGGKPITIGGVIFTDLKDPLRSGLVGATVTVEGDKGVFTTTTGGVLGLWKLDVPQGTYTVSPKKKDYAMQHLIGGWCDGNSSITIEVKPANLGPNQSIQFLAIDWPELPPESSEEPPAAKPASEPPQPAAVTEPAAPAPKTGRTGGGCATTREQSGRAGDFFTPYVACVSVLVVRSRMDARKRNAGRR